MSRLEQVRAALAGMAGGVGDTQVKAAAAETAAQHIADRAAQVGFTGIATSMASVRSTLAAVCRALSACADSIAEATALAATVRDGATPEHAQAGIAATGHKIGGVRTSIAAAVAGVDEARTRAAHVLKGGQPEPMIAALDAVTDTLAVIIRHGDIVKSLLDDSAEHARQLGGTTDGAPTLDKPSDSRPVNEAFAPLQLFDDVEAGAVVVTRPAVVPDDAAPFDPAVAARVPRYGAKGDKTTGIVVLADGQELPPQDSGLNGPARRMPKPRKGMDGVIVTHVEAHTIGSMREHQATEGEN